LQLVPAGSTTEDKHEHAASAVLWLVGQYPLLAWHDAQASMRSLLFKVSVANVVQPPFSESTPLAYNPAVQANPAANPAAQANPAVQANGDISQQATPSREVPAL
jgi:hypothetical protein